MNSWSPFLLTIDFPQHFPGIGTFSEKMCFFPRLWAGLPAQPPDNSHRLPHPDWYCICLCYQLPTPYETRKESGCHFAFQLQLRFTDRGESCTFLFTDLSVSSLNSQNGWSSTHRNFCFSPISGKCWQVNSLTGGSHIFMERYKCYQEVII